jgi:hypothetical protein
MTDIGSDFDTVWGAIFFTIALGLFVYIAITHRETITWLAPTAMFVLPFIVYPLCDTVGKIIQDFIDNFE